MSKVDQFMSVWLTDASNGIMGWSRGQYERWYGFTLEERQTISHCLWQSLYTLDHYNNDNAFYNAVYKN